ncbi:MAG TPA: hypothetical protein VFC63_07430 [Blastocatellia bacterium]|nr:hypothetical protein [Blastocatellia bacterium]
MLTPASPTKTEEASVGVKSFADYIRTRLKPLEQTNGAEAACREYADTLSSEAKQKFGPGAIPVRWEAVARWAAGQALPEGQHLAVLAADLRQPVGYMTLLVHYEREQNPEAKRYLFDLLGDRSLMEGESDWRTRKPEQVIEALFSRLGEEKLKVLTRHLMVRYLGYIADLLVRNEK